MPKANNRDRCLFENPPGTWWVRIYDPTTGQRIKRKAGSKTLAREIATSIQNDITRRKNGLPVETRITVGELLEKFEPEWLAKRSSVDDRRYANMVDREFGARPWFDVKPADVVAWRARLLAEKSSRTGRLRRPATANRAVSFLRWIYNLAIRDDLVTRNPAAKVSALDENNRVDRWVAPEGAEESDLRAAFAPEDWRICELGIHTGLRAGNLFGLARADVDLESEFVRVGRTKNGEPLVVPLSATAARLFKEILDEHDADWVFPSPRSAKKPRNYDAWYHRRFVPAVERAGVPHITFHQLGRHSFCSRLLNAGVGESAIAALAGQKTVDVTKRYAHHEADRLRDTVRKLDGPKPKKA